MSPDTIDPLANSRGCSAIQRFVVVTAAAASLVVVVAFGMRTPLMARARMQDSRKPSTQISTQEAALRKALFQLREAVDKFYLREKHYPRTLQDLVTKGFLKELPIDPFTDSRTSWRTMQAKRDPAHPRVPTGFFDVKSRSTRTAADGTKYSAW